MVKTLEGVWEEIVRKVVSNETFRAALQVYPKVAMQRELGIAIPEVLQFSVHQDGTLIINFVLTRAELSEAKLRTNLAGTQAFANSVNAWNMVEPEPPIFYTLPESGRKTQVSFPVECYLEISRQ